MPEFGLKVPTSAYLVAQDGYPIPAQERQEVILGPANADFIIDLPKKTSHKCTYNSDQPYPAVNLKAVDTTQTLVAKSPLNQPNLEAPPTLIDVTIPLHMQGGAMGNLRGQL